MILCRLNRVKARLAEIQLCKIELARKIFPLGIYHFQVEVSPLEIQGP